MGKSTKPPSPPPPPPSPPPPALVSPLDGIDDDDDDDDDDRDGNRVNEQLAADQPRAPIATAAEVSNEEKKNRSRAIKAAVLKIREVAFLDIYDPATRAQNIITISAAMAGLQSALALPEE